MHAGFHRDNVLLAVIVLSDHDDASPEDPASYAAALGAVADSDLLVSVLSPDPSPRLQQFLAAIPGDRGFFVPVGTADIAEVMLPIAQMMAVLLRET